MKSHLTIFVFSTLKCTSNSLAFSSNRWQTAGGFFCMVLAARPRSSAPATCLSLYICPTSGLHVTPCLLSAALTIWFPLAIFEVRLNGQKWNVSWPCDFELYFRREVTPFSQYRKAMQVTPDAWKNLPFLQVGTSIVFCESFRNFQKELLNAP